ncbi:conserved hypothetical protein [Neospora caninum Liverpool]|nr:conserved hypothetical protein [Neospora caninum Liverpool]CBZ53439.1 conserved hypothetical protein [Neospora caninum Liverpool]|eukprot:XP_003883471.1 conserved hypothetical protein [Neospora caninum Liverpool]
MLVRASAYPRTKWSALAFLEGFYGLPRGCLVSPDDLLRTEGKKSGETWCVTRKVCTEVAGAHLPEPTSSGVTRLPGNALTVAHAFTHADKQCVDFQLPCVTAAPAASDGLARGVISSDAPATVWKLFGEIKAKPLWIKKAAELDQVLRTAAEVFGEKAVGELGWMIGDTLVCEEAAGEEVPLKKLHEWFESHDPEKGHLQRRGTAEAEAGEHPAERAPSKNSTRVSLSTSGSATHLTGASEADGRFGVHTYLGAIGDIREAFRAGFDLVYADEKLGKYIAQGPVRLLNAFFRTKAYGRQTDVEELRRIAAEVGGFETFLHPELAVSTGEKKSESGGEPQFSSGSGGDEKFLQAVQDVMVMLLSLHDHCLVGFLATLGVYDHAIVPPGARVYVELVRIDKPFKAARGRTHDAGSSSRQETPFVRGRGRDTIPQKVSDGGVRDGNTNRGQQPDTRIDDEGATTSVSLGSTESNRELPTFEGAYTEHRRDWPPSGFFVRLSYGGPERSMQEIALPFCAEKMSPDDTRLENLCPLDVWLTWTYEELDR